MAAGNAKFADPSGASLLGDLVSTPGFMAGVEAAANGLVSQATNTCLAYSGLFVSANCRAQPRMIGDLTVRNGWAYGQYAHSLF
jgi:hypothetical protein